MDKLLIRGGKPLRGEVTISGAKNAALPILAASILAGEPITLANIPHLRDITTMMEVLASLGLDLLIDEHMQVHIDSRSLNAFKAPYDLVKTMRASIVVLGPLLSRHGQAMVAMQVGVPSVRVQWIFIFMPYKRWGLKSVLTVVTSLPKRPMAYMARI